MSMLLDLSQFRGGAEHVERRFEPGTFAPEEEFRVVAPVVLTADVRKDAEKVRLVGQVTTTLELPCSRCLEPFTIPVDARFDLLFLPASERSEQEGEQAMDEQDVSVSYYDKDVIDLGEVVREQFYLALPMKPLCREDCAGLCPVCGVNRNRESCSCQTAWVDPRMEPLRRFRSH